MNTIELIQEAFNNHNIKYRIVETEQISFIDAGYNIQGGPTVRFHFISQNIEDSNDVQMRIFGLLNKISTEKRGTILEACNKVNSELRFLKFYVEWASAASSCLSGACRFWTSAIITFRKLIMQLLFHTKMRSFLIRSMH